MEEEEERGEERRTRRRMEEGRKGSPLLRVWLVVRGEGRWKADPRRNTPRPRSAVQQQFTARVLD